MDRTLRADTRRFRPAALGVRLAARAEKGWTDKKAGLFMSKWEDARAEELHNLRLALATFALQLDAFEMRASGAFLAARREASIAAPRPDRVRDSEGGK
jgi:hypothetical protein